MKHTSQDIILDVQKDGVEELSSSILSFHNIIFISSQKEKGVILTKKFKRKLKEMVLYPNLNDNILDMLHDLEVMKDESSILIEKPLTSSF